MDCFKGAIFDLDGTLIDSMGVWKKVDVDFFNNREIAMPDDYIDAISSMTFREVAIYTIERFNLEDSVEDLISEWNEMAIYEYSNNIGLKPFAKEYLELLKKRGIKISLATVSPKELYEPVLKNNGIYDLFDAFTCVDEVDRGKDYPDIYYLACEKIGLKPKECIGFEDVLKGIKSMKIAGIKAVGIYDDSSIKEIEEMKKISDKYIYTFKEMF